MTEGVDSMEERLDKQDERITKQDERITKQDERLNHHSDKINQLFKREEDQDKRIIEVQQNYAKLEDTIVSENKEMRLFFISNMDKQWDLIKSRDIQKHDSKEMEHDLKKMEHELKKSKMEKYSDIIFKLVGSGGLIYLIVQALIK